MAERTPGTVTPLRLLHDAAAGHCDPQTGACVLPEPAEAGPESGPESDLEPPEAADRGC